MSLVTRNLGRIALACLCSVAAACGSDVDEENPLDDEIEDGSKADSLRNPTQHNAYFFGTSPRADVAGHSNYHAWQFELSGEAHVRLEAFNGDWRGPSNTALYVYRKTSANRWRIVAKDATASGVPELAMDLSKGAYRIIIKGATKTTNETVGLSGSCEGAGCPVAADLCLFGERAGADLAGLNNSYVTTVRDTTYPVTYEELDGAPQDQRELVHLHAMMRALTGDDVTLKAAFEMIDDGVVRSSDVWDMSGNSYTSYQFELAGGGKAVTAFFRNEDHDAGEAAMYAGTQTLSCLERAPVCAFGASLVSLREQFAQTKVTRVEDATALDEVAREQVVLAANNVGRRSSFDTAADALAGIGAVTFVTYRDPATAQEFTVVTFADNDRDGLIFEAGTANVAAKFEYGSVSRCGVTRRESDALTR